MEANKAVDQIVGVLGIAGSITTAISLAALSLLIAFLLSRSWLRGKHAAVENAIKRTDNDALARILGGTSVPLESLSPDQKYSLAEKELHTRAFLRVLGYALIFFAFIGLLGFASILVFKTPNPNSAAPEPKKVALTQLDAIDVLGILRYVQKERRQEVCAKLLSAEQCSRSESLLNELEYQQPAPDQRRLVSVAEKQGGVDVDQLRDLAACGGSFHFRILNNFLVCQDGTPVPVLNGRNDGDMKETVEGLVFHSTSSSDDSFAQVSELLAYGRPDLPGSLAHLLISRSGAVVQLVPFNHRANHAGITGPWNGVLLNNSNSIGVQLINKGPESQEPFTPQQIEAAEGIAKAFAAAYGVKLIANHSEIALPPGRRTDPGPLFPINDVRIAAGLPEDKSPH